MNNKSVQYGLITGILAIIVNVIGTLFFPTELLSQGFGTYKALEWVVVLLVLFFMWKAAADKKRELGGFISFKEALKNSYLVGVVYSVISYLFTLLSKFILFKDVWDNAFAKFMDLQIEKMGEGISEKEVEQSIELVSKIINFGIFPIILILFFIPALIIAAIVKKNRPDAY